MNNNRLVGAFTDGDLRRLIQEKGRNALQSKLADLTFKDPITIDANALLNDAHNMFKQSHVDTLIVVDDGKPVGVLDIQDLNENV
jgi:signal-transduction protein with cAMP-binding, CBS, and nucleotidyltransferase domain